MTWIPVLMSHAPAPASFARTQKSSSMNHEVARAQSVRLGDDGVTVVSPFMFGAWIVPM